MKNFFIELLCCCALLSFGACAHIDVSNYPFSKVLSADGRGNPRYTLYWNFSVAAETISFVVNVSTNGWVGFGVSPNGGMVNSDVVIGWVNDAGQPFLHVSVATACVMLLQYVHVSIVIPTRTLTK